MCASEAATISIVIHVLILFAGSIVAIKIVQKRDAAFEGEKIDRPSWSVDFNLEERRDQQGWRVRGVIPAVRAGLAATGFKLEGVFIYSKVVLMLRVT